MGSPLDHAALQERILRPSHRRYDRSPLNRLTDTAGNQDLGAELFQMETGTKMLHVPYKGSGGAMADLSGGHVQLMFAGFGQAKSFVDSGQLMALAVTAPRRSIAYPNVPTLTELGLGKVDAGTYWGALAPKGTPDDVVKTDRDRPKRRRARRDDQPTSREQGLFRCVRAPPATCPVGCAHSRT